MNNFELKFGYGDTLEPSTSFFMDMVMAKVIGTDDEKGMYRIEYSTRRNTGIMSETIDYDVLESHMRLR